MLGECYYQQKNRFYGLFIQLPWSFFVTMMLILPVYYMADVDTRALLIQIVAYWVCAVALLWYAKDKYVQNILREFSFAQDAIYVKRNSGLLERYTWKQIDNIRAFDKNSNLAKLSLSCGGVVLTFEDGYQLIVLRKIVNYEVFCSLLEKNILRA